MPDYKEMYFKLTAKVADAVDLLISAQQEGEEAYLEGSPPILTILTPESQEE
ncbi:hypothetical protein FACS1894217_15800 [Clostridia bacterium]|nr:hypothetical protein FACS1894217_15800 [Clostridia bacterium]